MRSCAALLLAAAPFALCAFQPYVELSVSPEEVVLTESAEATIRIFMPKPFQWNPSIIPIPQGCLFSANSRALPGSALQIPCSSTSTPCPNPALCAPVNTSDWGVQGRGTPLCVGLTLSCLPWTNCFTLH